MTNESDVSELAAVGWALYDTADFVAASHQFERALEADPDDVEALRGLARIRLSENDLAAAILLLERALGVLEVAHAVAPESTEQRVRYDLAWALYRVDRFDLAARHFFRLPGYEQIGRKLEAFGDETPYLLPVEAPTIELPLLAADPLPFVRLQLGGRDHVFVIDTGAGELVLDRALLDELDLPDHGIRETTFAGGRRTTVVHSILPELSLGTVTVENIPVEAIDVRSRAPQLSGFIGLNFLLHFHPTLDYAGRRLLLAPRDDDVTPPSEAHSVSLRLFEDHVLVAPGAINGHETFLVLASGMAGGAFTCPESTVNQADVTVYEEDVLEGVSVAGGEALLALHADRVRLGTAELRDVDGFGGGFSPSLEWRYGFRIGGIVAHGFLRHFRWTIDQDRMTAWLEQRQIEA